MSFGGKGRCLMCGGGMNRYQRGYKNRKTEMCRHCLKWIRKRRKDNDGRI